ncbi:MAG: L-serine ammonia-lyase, iron-sulfur-dependent, subunit alpha [Bacteroidales bacterium]|jgi:L-cysteine desulfidase|nr:L-serine ammonia-lyase, iron-sulfur-dependent, subunit alpha [Bacteroidales bacterium]
MNFTKINDILHRNIVLAVGCTEPAAVALAAVKAKEVLLQNVEDAAVKKVILRLSGNVIKNALGVGIPSTGMIGLPIAVALAIVGGRSSRGLEVLADGAENLSAAKDWLSTHDVEIQLKEDAPKLYIEAICCGEDAADFGRVVISGQHTHFVLIEDKTGILYQADSSDNDSADEDDVLSELNAEKVFRYALTVPIYEIMWLMDVVATNNAMVAEGLRGDYGLRSGFILNENAQTMRQRIIAATCAASDGRMGGATLPIYSNFGSGNQGITCTLPVYYFGKERHCDDELILRALALSNLMSIYIKSRIGRLSALCGIVNASIGVSAAWVLLDGGDFGQITHSVRNMINTITGMICDGAKGSCALKISAGLNAAYDSYLLAMARSVVDKTDGIADEDVDKSIENLGRIGEKGMNETDRMILDIMTHKK